MSSINSDEENKFSMQDVNRSISNKQSQLSQKDMFDDDDEDSDINIEELENNPASVTNQLHVLPAVAVPEKIVFCIDTTFDLVDGYLLEDSQNPPSTDIVRNEAIRVFVTNKLSIARDTEFALVSLAPGKAELASPLSSNIEQFMNSLVNLKNSPTSESSDYDITPMFNIVWNKFSVPQEPKPTSIPPNHIVRLILIYGNSFLVPNVNFTNDFYKNFVLSPFCMLDVFYLHDKPSDINNVGKIFEYFVKMAPEHSYVLENARNVTTMFNKMSKFLAHPCQRVPQEMWSF